MAEGEERVNFDMFVVSISDVDTFAVDYFEILARPVVVCGCIL